MAELFPTGYFQANGIMTCSNGDKVRSDDQGLFCWIGGQRVPYPEPVKPTVATASTTTTTTTTKTK